MRKCILFGYVLVAFTVSNGCVSNGDYCCTSNDQCYPTPEGQHSCSNDKCWKCVLVQPLTITPITLPDATIGQSNYSVELATSGGIPPYTWQLTRGDETKLSWLTVTPEGDTKALLQNLTVSDVPIPPNEASTGLNLTITVLDSSKHGKTGRSDNQGEPFQMTMISSFCLHWTWDDTGC